MGGGYIGTKDGVISLPCPVEYEVLRAVRYMNGAMRPDELLPGYPVGAWVDYANLSEAVEMEVKKGKENRPAQGMVINIRRPEAG